MDVIQIKWPSVKRIAKVQFQICSARNHSSESDKVKNDNHCPRTGKKIDSYNIFMKTVEFFPFFSHFTRLTIHCKVVGEFCLVDKNKIRFLTYDVFTKIQKKITQQKKKMLQYFLFSYCNIYTTTVTSLRIHFKSTTTSIVVACVRLLSLASRF